MAQPDDPYAIYLEQVMKLMKERGLDKNEIEKALSVYRDNKISSDQDFAKLLNKLYPLDKGILIIFFQFSNDTLRRVVFEPGFVKETRLIPIRASELLQLSTDFNHALGLYNASANRMPVKRGGIVKPPPPSKGLHYDSLVKKATRLLLPAWFNQQRKHLIIIPALNLGTLPFYLLQPYEDSSLLIDHCSFSIAPAAGDLVALRMKLLKAKTNWNGKLNLPFGLNQSFKKVDTQTYRLQYPLFISNPAYPQQSEYSFPDLPGAGREVEGAMQYADSFRLLKGKQAQKDSVIQYIGQADVAYFATHGIASTEDPMHKSFLVLSGADPFLSAKDIIALRNRPDSFPGMVILSACQTGLGKSMEAGVAGLARAFMLSGAQHVIMSLWNVDDESTAYLMNRFLFHLIQPTLFLPAEPLRKAMLDTRKKFPHPSQWAGFSMFGVDY